MKTTRLRGEHIVNLIEHLSGVRLKWDELRGYNDAFARAHDEVLAAVLACPEGRVEIVAGYDDICNCGVCPNRREECDSPAYRENDAAIALRYDLTVGQVSPTTEFIRLLQRFL